jgi:hypothetical protein
MSRLSRQCGILKISQSYRPPRPVTGIAFPFFLHNQRYLVSYVISRNRLLGPTLVNDTVNRELCFLPLQCTFIWGRIRQRLLAQVVFPWRYCALFGDRIVSKAIWLPRSPHLTPPNCYFWGAMNAPVYKQNSLVHWTEECQQKLHREYPSNCIISCLEMLVSKRVRTKSIIWCNSGTFEECTCVNAQGLFSAVTLFACHTCSYIHDEQTKLRGLSLRANYTDRPTECQLLRIEGATWSVWRIPKAVFSPF